MTNDTPGPIETSELTCPTCGHVSIEMMPTDACIYFHRCAGCGSMLRPKAGDCCVFCSFGSVACPPVQSDRQCCRFPASSGLHSPPQQFAPPGRR
ncbi:MAG: GDCCVxC domain-containing (seleno)protein [Steroidobacteraceae bacterium]